MSEFSPRMGWPYPSRDDDPWYDPFVDFIQASDGSAFAAREDRSVIWSGGGTLSWTVASGTLTWTDTISVYSPLGGRLLQVAAGSVAGWIEGEVLYVPLVRQPAATTSVSLVKASHVPSDDNAMALAVRVGTSIFFRTGISLGDGDTADGLAPVPVAGGGPGSDTTAIHDNVAGEIAAVTEKATPVSADLLLIEDSADSNNKKRVQVGNLPGGTDPDAIHDNVAGEIAVITAKATPTTSDLLLIEDAADSNNKKRVTIGDLPGGGGADGRGFAIVIGNSLEGDTSDICDYLDVGDCAQLKAGIEAAAGKPVYIRPGTYDWNNGSATSNRIVVPLGTRVLGAGMNAVTIRLLDTALEAEAFSLGSGSVLEDVEISVPTPTGLVLSSYSQAYIWFNNISNLKSIGMRKVRIKFEDNGWTTLAGDYVGMQQVVYSDFNGKRVFVEGCEFLDIPNGQTAPSNWARLRVLELLGSADCVEIHNNFSWGGYAANEIAGDEISINDNIFGGIVDAWALRLVGNGASPGTERPARVVNNDFLMLYDATEFAIYGILDLTGAGSLILGNNITLEGGTYASTYAVGIVNGRSSVIAANRMDAESGWTYAADLGSSTTGTIVANHFGSATITGTTAGWSIGLNYPGGGITDSNAIHDNVAAEILAITEKVTPVSADLLLIEDSADSNNKKRVQVGNLPGGSDPDAIHDNVAAEISAVAAKATPTTSDYILIEDAAAADAKKSITIGDLPAATPAAHDLGGAEHNSATLAQLNAKVSDATLDDSSDPRDPNAHTLGGAAHSADTLANLNAKISDATLDDASDPRTDDNAIHDNVSGEITALTEKVSPVGADVLVIEDSAAGNSKKKVQITNLPGGADPDAIHDNVAGEIAAVTEKATPVSADLLLIEDSADSNNKKRVQVGNLPGGSGTDPDAIHDNVAAEISAIAAKATPTTSDYLVIEDAAAGDAKKSITIGNLPAAAPATHASTHEPGGGDAMTVDAAAATGSLRTLGTGAQQACAGNDSRLSDNRTDADAIHDNVAGEIVLVTEKTTPVSADLILIEDSADSNNKKRVQVGNLPGGSTATYAEATSYRELASNALDTQGVSVVENDVGEGVFDAGLHQSILFRSTLTADWASTGTLTVSLYDDGPVTAPGTPRLVTSFAKTADGGYEVFEQALAIVSTGAGSNQVLGAARVYRVTIEVDGTTGDTGYIGSAGLVATGSAETLSADEVQAIAMSLNA